MRRRIIIASVIGAAFATAAFADRGAWLPAVGCIAWMALVLIASMKRPRAATRGKKENISTYQDSFRLYNLTDDARFQERIRIMKAWEDAR